MVRKFARGAFAISLVSIALDTVPASADRDRDRDRDDRRDHRRRDYDDDQPRSAPPPLRAERVGRRRGFVWVSGSWEWQRGRWAWTNGHWERARAGRRFRAPRWERRGDVYVRIDGGWEDRGAPPQAREERVVARPGFVFVRGQWEWDEWKDEWVWQPGHWERERRGKRWRDHRWENQGGEWVRVDGGWDDDDFDADDFPTAEPPRPRDEVIAPRAGFVWIPGRWEWRRRQWQWVDGRWEAERVGSRFTPGRWEYVSGRWRWTDGRWDAAPVAAYPTSAPPVAPAETIPSFGRDQVWIAGHYEWRNGRYEWAPGRLEGFRRGFRFQPGSWSLRGDRYVWTEGQWVNDFPSGGPPPLRDERWDRRAGSVFIRGRWDWMNGQWVWIDGHWEKARVGQRFAAGRWEQRNNRWEWIDGTWGAVPQFPPLDDVPPQANESPQSRAGYVWQPGRWAWDGSGEYVWVAGQLVPERRGFKWNPGRWIRGQANWQWEEGRWVEAPVSEPYDGAPRYAPPAPREERPGYRNGYIWARGFYEWRNGAYQWVDGHWEAEQPYRQWLDARWDQRGDIWVFTPGRWQ